MDVGAQAGPVVDGCGAVAGVGPRLGDGRVGGDDPGEEVDAGGVAADVGGGDHNGESIRSRAR
jgi:hypothetical protein